MVRVPFQDSERAIDLLQKYYPRQLMRHRHFSQRQRELRRCLRFLIEAVRPANGKHQRQWISILIISQEFRELLKDSCLPRESIRT